MQKVQLSELKPLANNPRTITKEDMERLKASIKKFGVLEWRPLIVSTRTGENIIVGWNQRYEACKALKIKEVPVFFLDPAISEADEREIIIRDNVNNGEWDMDALANEWSDEPLADWGVEVPNFSEGNGDDGEKYTTKIEIPIYEITGEKPEISELCDTDKLADLLLKIRASELPEDEKKFFELAAHRFSVFDYQKIAEYYAHAGKETQEIMEDLALVIIDYNKAIENWLVLLSKQIDEMHLDSLNSQEDAE